VSWTWDDAGSLVSRTAANQTTLYAINAFGQLERVTLPSGPVVEYAYDGAGRRVSRRVNGAVTDTWIYQDALNPVAWFDGAGQLKATFLYASLPHVPDLMITPTATYRLVTDHLGSVTDVVNVVTGAVVQRMRYDTFGVVLSDSQPGMQPFGFAGGLYDDATGLVRFGARDYDAEVGRWISKDPVRFDGGTNLFAYVGGDPVNFVDVTGEISRPVWGLIVTGGVLVVGALLYGGYQNHVESRDGNKPMKYSNQAVVPGSKSDIVSWAYNSEPDECFNWYGHGSDVGFASGEIESNGTDKPLSMEDLAAMTLAQPGYQPGMCVTLNACEIGNGNAPAFFLDYLRAQTATNTPKTTLVRAHRGELMGLPDGTTFTAPNLMENYGWREYTP